MPRLKAMAACLLARVPDEPGRRGQPGERNQVDDVSAAARAHPLYRRECPVDRPDGVHLEHPAVDVDRLLVGEPGEQDSRVVDPDVEGPAPLDHLIGRSVDRIRVGDVQDQWPGARPPSCSAAAVVPASSTSVTATS